MGLGELHEARKCFEKAMRINEKVYGPDHPHVAITATISAGFWSSW